MRCDMRWADRILLPIVTIWDFLWPVTVHVIFSTSHYRKLQFNLTRNILIKKVKKMFVDVEMNFFFNQTKTTDPQQIDLIWFDSIRFDFSKLKLMTSQPRRRERSSHRKESFRERCILCFRLGFFFFFFFCFSKKFLEMISNSEKIKVWEFKSPPRKSVGARIPDFTEVLRGFFFLLRNL